MGPNSLDMDRTWTSQDTNWTFFCERLITLINYNTRRRNTKAKTHLPWITRELTRLQRKHNKSHIKAKQTEKNKERRKQATKALAISYKDYVNNQIGDSMKSNPKRVWSFIKANKRENIAIPTLRVNDQPIINDCNKADALNNQFSSVFTPSPKSPINLSQHPHPRISTH